MDFVSAALLFYGLSEIRFRFILPAGKRQVLHSGRGPDAAGSRKLFLHCLTHKNALK